MELNTVCSSELEETTQLLNQIQSRLTDLSKRHMDNLRQNVTQNIQSTLSFIQQSPPQNLSPSANQVNQF